MLELQPTKVWQVTLKSFSGLYVSWMCMLTIIKNCNNLQWIIIYHLKASLGFYCGGNRAIGRTRALLCSAVVTGRAWGWSREGQSSASAASAASASSFTSSTVTTGHFTFCKLHLKQGAFGSWDTYHHFTIRDHQANLACRGGLNPSLPSTKWSNRLKTKAALKNKQTTWSVWWDLTGCKGVKAGWCYGESSHTQEATHRGRGAEGGWRWSVGAARQKANDDCGFIVGAVAQIRNMETPDWSLSEGQKLLDVTGGQVCHTRHSTQLNSI